MTPPRKPRPLAFELALACAAIGIGCGADEVARDSVALEPVAITDQEGAVCGMLIREQSAPRAQVVHRDGERSFVCSLGDLLAYLDAPSPHGAPERILVEVMDAAQDPDESHTGPHPWIAAEAAVYVVGIERPQIMGAAVLTYSDRASAERVTAGTTAAILDWDELGKWWAAQSGAAHP